MKDWDTDKVILSKIVRRKTFVLGRDAVLVSKSVALMDDGRVMVISVRRKEHVFRGVGVAATYLRATSYPDAVDRVRAYECAYITAELPENPA
ncbi:hypothetical protein [Streptomyces sp. NPDC053048]|uniref:hypothetical protein n=1 Tax=Streptomyces sp. NPDC053048 TaxID=3365694 RepID=UPI0037CF7BCC